MASRPPSTRRGTPSPRASGWSTSTSCSSPSSPSPRTSCWAASRGAGSASWTGGRLRPASRRSADATGSTSPADAVIEDLTVGVQQRVEIVKALYRDAKILILDEPTAVLTPQETEDLFEVLRSLRDAGTSIIFITHKLKEVLEIADRITVMRRGRVVGSAAPSETSEQDLAAMMVGRAVQLRVDKSPAQPGDPVLEIGDLVVRDDRGQIAVDGVSLDVHAGEIVCVAGVQGNGQTELVEAIAGVAPRGRWGYPGARSRRHGGEPSQGLARWGRPRPRGSPAGRADRGLLHRGQPRPEHVRPAAVRAMDRAEVRGGPRRGRGAGLGVRRAHPIRRGPSLHAVRRQPAEGDRGPGVLAPHLAADRQPADARARRGVDRVHPRTDRAEAGRGSGGPDRVGGARRGVRARRPDRGHVRGTDRQHRAGARPSCAITSAS